MISKSTTKLIKSLALKKIRQKEKLFLVEGDKNVGEVLMSDFEIKKLFATASFISEHEKHLLNITFEEVSKEEIKKASLLRNPQNSIAICRIPTGKSISNLKKFDLALYLDFIQDPGNLGTIVRICDWFGIENLFCSPDSVDLYNPKTIQASMGSFCHVKVWYNNLYEIKSQFVPKEITIYGTYLNEKNVFKTRPEKNSLIVLGNEGKGIRKDLENFMDEKISIPGCPVKEKGAESLNVGVAAGIISAHFRNHNLLEMK